jgi:S1-C subfamily serine protease
MKRVLAVAAASLVLFAAGCATYNTTDYEKPSLSRATVDEIEGILDDGRPAEAAAIISALEGSEVPVDPLELERLFAEAVMALREGYAEALDAGDYDRALSHLYSLRIVDEGGSIDAEPADLILEKALQYLDNDQPLPALTVFQRVLKEKSVDEESLDTFAAAAVREKNRAIGGRIAEAYGDRSVPEDLTEFLSEQPVPAEMIRGTVTVWVDRGMKLEGGVGYPERAIGSGFFIDRRGYLLTNYHVVSSEVDPEYEGFSRLYIRLPERPEEKVPAKVVGFDRIFDIALLKAEITPDYVFSLNDTEEFAPGERIFAIGSPGGLESTITSGIISAVGRRFLQLGDAMQVDVPVNPGNSGGPLLNDEGQLVGVIFAGLEQFEGVNFAIPAHWVNMILPKLYEGGEVVHPWLGLAVQELKGELETMYTLPGEPAQRVGILEGKPLASVNGIGFETIRDIQEYILQFPPDTLVEVEWGEGESAVEELAFLTERPFRPMDLALKRDRKDRLLLPLFGMGLKETDSVFWKPNYTVEKIYRGSIADETGLSESDPVSIQRFYIEEEYRVAVLQMYVMKRKAGFLEKAIQLAAYLEIDYFI